MSFCKSNYRLFIFLLLFFTLTKFAEAHHLSGKVEVEGGKNLKNLIVYLEPVDPSKLKLKPKLHK
ncbi:MAG: hypothetical protein VW455_14115, partial [Nitrospinota bacterium]